MFISSQHHVARICQERFEQKFMWNWKTCAILDISRVCRSTSLIAQCAQGHLSECVGQQVCQAENFFGRYDNQLSIFMLQLGIAAFNEIKNLALNCCPDRNSANCSIRGLSQISILTDHFSYFTFRFDIARSTLFCSWLSCHSGQRTAQVHYTTTIRWYYSRLRR